MLVSVQATPDNDRGPKYAEQFFASVHQANGARFPLTLEYSCYRGPAGLFLRFPRKHARLIKGQFAGLYPHVEQVDLPEHALHSRPEDGAKAYWMELQLQNYVYPLLPYEQAEDSLHRVLNDPIAGILAALASDNRHHPSGARIELVLWPALPRRQGNAQHTVHCLMNRFMVDHPRYARWFVRYHSSHHRLHRLLARFTYRLLRLKKRTEETEAGRQALQKLDSHCFEARLRLHVVADSRASAVARMAQLRGALGQFTSPGRSVFAPGRMRRGNPPPAKPRAGWLLSQCDVATLFHPTTEAVRSPNRHVSRSRRLEPPPALPKPADANVLALGRVSFQQRRELFGVRELDRFQHIAITGKTGQGKSGLLNRMIVEDMRRGRGVAVIEPHGDLSEQLLSLVPKRRTGDVIYFDPSDCAHPPAYNPLAVRDAAHKPIVAEEVLAAVKKVFEIDETNSPRMLYILRNGILALLDVPGANLLDLQHLMRDAARRKSMLRHVQDAEVRSFWHSEFEPLPEKLKLEWTMPIRNKIGAFTVNPILREILGRSDSKIDLRSVMDEGKILIVNLSKGKLTENASQLLGALLMAGIQAAAMSRADTAECNRRPFFCYVDEFQNLASDTFASILSESRKMKLGLCVAHQYLEQLPESVAAAVFGNVGNYLSFAVGADDATRLATYFGGDITAQDLANLPRFQAAIKLLLNGSPASPFTMETLPPFASEMNARQQQVRAHSQRRYARSTASSRPVASIR